MLKQSFCFVRYLRYYNRRKTESGPVRQVIQCQFPCTILSRCHFYKARPSAPSFLSPIEIQRAQNVISKGKKSISQNSYRNHTEGESFWQFKLQQSEGSLLNHILCPIGKCLQKQVSIECMFCRSRAGNGPALQPLFLTPAMLRHTSVSVFVNTPHEPWQLLSRQITLLPLLQGRNIWQNSRLHGKNGKLLNLSL